MFGYTEWRNTILNEGPLYKREEAFIEPIKNVYINGFRYVLPMPSINPKGKTQINHQVILCSKIMKYE
jgi:hypothetical protein